MILPGRSYKKVEMKCSKCGKEIDYGEMEEGYSGNECADCNLKRF
jgi:DNA-directed RNA polymerase subunit RPC12/RpoP